MDVVLKTQYNILRSYRNYVQQMKNPKSFRQYCFPNKYELQASQLFLRDYMKKGGRSLLIYHKIGSGKTCSAIQIGEEWIDKMKVYIVVPAALIENVYKEFLSQCTGNKYISEEDRDIFMKNNKDKLAKGIYRDFKKLVDSKYNIVSYNKFVSLIESNEVVKSAVYIFDEVQNIVSEKGVFYRVINDFLSRVYQNSKIVLLSGTPIVDSPVELALTFNLLQPSNKLAATSTEFNRLFVNADGSINNRDVLKNALNGYVSFYSGAPDKVFPLQDFKIINCRMRGAQLKEYKNTSVAKDGFYLKQRMVSNIALPSDFSEGTEVTEEWLKNHSIKYYKLLKRLKNSRGPVFVYSNFKEEAGLGSLTMILEKFGYSPYETAGVGKKRYAVWSGDTSDEKRRELLHTFNSPKNHNGSKIKVILGSPSIKEGVSLLRVRQVHILEPHWNMSRIQQIIGRAVRYCSHRDVELHKRRVSVFLYLAISSTRMKNLLVDPYILTTAKNKEILLNSFDELLYDVSIDKLLWSK